MPLGQLRESSRREEEGDSGTPYHRQTMPVGGRERSFLGAGRCPFERGWWRKRLRIPLALRCVGKEIAWEGQ